MKKVAVLFYGFLISTQACALQILKDPTRPAVKPGASSLGAVNSDANSSGLAENAADAAGFPNVKLSAIVVTEPVKYAIINNEVVYEGQTWRNVVLSRVKPYSIVLTSESQEKEITINDNDFIIESDYEN